MEKISRAELIEKAVQGNFQTLDSSCSDPDLYQSFVVAVSNYLKDLDSFTETLGEERSFLGTIHVYSVQFFNANKNWFCAIVGDNEDPKNTLTRKVLRTVIIDIKDFIDIKQAKITSVNDSLKHAREEADLLMGKLGSILEKIEKLEKCLSELN